MKCLLHNIYIDKDSLEYATTSMFMESFQTYVIYIYREGLVYWACFIVFDLLKYLRKVHIHIF